jgi:hypothetical protein
VSRDPSIIADWSRRRSKWSFSRVEVAASEAIASCDCPPPSGAAESINALLFSAAGGSAARASKQQRASDISGC